MKEFYYLKDLDCANCAAKIEAKIKTMPSVTDASINFIKKKLMVEFKDNNTDSALMLNKLQSVTDSVEDGVVLSPWNQSKKSSAAEDSHEHDHGPGPKASRKKGISPELWMVIAGTIVSFGSIALSKLWAPAILFVIPGYLMLGSKVLLASLKNIRRGHIFDENFLVAIATIGALIIGEYAEGIAVMVLYQFGEFLQDLAVDKSRKHLTEAMNLKAEYANLKTPGGLKTVEPESLSIGDMIVIKPSEKVPLDGVIIEGSSFVDTSSLTGESVPRSVKPGDELLSGCINGSSLLTLQVTKKYSESTVAKVLELVENAASRKSSTENFITKFARVYTPIVVLAAVVMAIVPPILTGNYDFAAWIYKACGFLVVSCPCALVISIPLGFFGGIGCASKHGIVIKGSNYLEALNHVTYSVFDKTGTLTKGSFRVTDVLTAEGVTKDQVIRYAALAESLSTHPIAKSITAACKEPLDLNLVNNYEEVAGHGLKASIRNERILLGNKKLLEMQGTTGIPIADLSGTVTYLAVNGRYLGTIIIADEIKEDSAKAIRELKKMGIHTVMLTGDARKTAEKAAEEIGIEQVYAELLPGDKVEKIEDLIKNNSDNGKVIFTGDGINDAPVLARADIGAAMGGVGSDAAVEAADIVLMTDEPSRLPIAIKIARYTRKIVAQNIVLSLGIKFIVLILLAIGMGSMWLAVFADVGVSMIAIFNSIRALKARFQLS